MTESNLLEHQWLSFDERKDIFGALHAPRNPSRPTVTRADLDQMYLDAQAEDLQADYQASIVILFADDALQRLAKGLLDKAPGLHPGYGRAYNGVPLTTLLRACTNALRVGRRHVAIPLSGPVGIARESHCKDGH